MLALEIEPSAPISRYFTYHEALWLPQYSRLADEEDGLDQSILDNLKDLFNSMDSVRDFVMGPIAVHCAYRPLAYNKLVGGAVNSAHMWGRACDFHVKSFMCDDVRNRIMSQGMLEKWNMRMENNPGATWVHLDRNAVLPGHERFFLP